MAGKGINISNKEQMEYLITLIENTMSSLKPKEFLKNGTMIAILLPAWNGYLNCVFNKFTPSKIEAFSFFCAVGMVVLFMVVTISGVKVIVQGLYVSIFGNEYNKYKNLKERLEDIRLYALNTKNLEKKIIS